MTMVNEREMRRRRAAMKRRAERKRKAMIARFMLAGMVAAIILLTVGVVTVINNAKADDSVEETYIPQHEGKFETFRYEVKGGESLGIIAARFIQQYNSDDAVDDVVNRIINYTGLDRTEATYHLQAGQMISVPLWTNVEELN